MTTETKSAPVSGWQRILRVLCAPGMVWVAGGMVAASLVMLQSINQVLGDIESSGQRSFDAGVFTGLKWRFRETGELASALALWREGSVVAKSLVNGNLLVDPVGLVKRHLLVDWVGLVLPYCFLTWLLLDRFKRGAVAAGVMAGVLFVMDTAENVFTWRLFQLDPIPKAGWLLWRVQLFSLLKWVSLILVLATAVGLWLQDKGPGRLLTFVQSARKDTQQHPAFALGELLVLVAIFSAIVALPAGGPLEQLPDVLRHAFGSESVRPGVSLTLAFLVLVGSILAAGVVATLPQGSKPPHNHWLVWGVALGWTALAVIAQKCFDREVNAVAGAPFYVAAGLTVVWILAGRFSLSIKKHQFDGSPAEESPQRWGWIGALTGLVVVTGGLALIRAAFPLVLLGSTQARWWAALILGLLFAVFGGLAVWARVVRAEARIETWRGALLSTGAAVVLVAGGLFLDPSIGASWGTGSVLAVAFAFLALAIGSLKRLSRWAAPWSVTYDLGFTRGTPWLGLLVVTWVVASAVNVEGVYHDVRVMKKAGYTHQYTDLDSALTIWLTPADSACGARPRPMVMVAAPGGGIRAAYWTVIALDKLFHARGNKCAPATLFAISGVSGGSVGATTWLASAPEPGRKAVTSLSADHALAGAAAALLLRDLFQPFTGIRTWQADRAAVLEDGFIESASGVFGKVDSPLAWANVGEAIEWNPVLMLNASSVTDGCRIVVANVGGLPAVPGEDCGASPLQGPPAGPVSASIDPFPGLYPRPDKPPSPGDTVTCGSLQTGMRAVTAALLSARFAGVTPSGAMLRCLSGSPELATYAVDGGYFENSGLLTLVQVWEAIEPRVRQHNCGVGASSQIVPWIVVLDNHYRTKASLAPTKRPRELIVPFRASMSNGTLSQTALEQVAATAVGGEEWPCPTSTGADSTRADSTRADSTRKNSSGFGCFVVIAPTRRPSVSAPLGWVLSKVSRDDLDSQLVARLDGQGAPDPVLAALLGQLSGTASLDSAPYPHPCPPS